MLIKLEKFKMSDAGALISWIPNQEFLMQWGGPSYTFPLTEEQLYNEFEISSSEHPKMLMFSVKLCDTDELVGHIQLLHIDLINMSARIGRVLVGDKNHRNKGIGVEMINSILSIAFDTLKLHRVDLGVFDFNKGAIACYEKVGFKIEGIFRDSRKIDEEYWSLINMSVLEHEYRSL